MLLDVRKQGCLSTPSPVGRTSKETSVHSEKINLGIGYLDRKRVMVWEEHIHLSGWYHPLLRMDFLSHGRSHAITKYKKETGTNWRRGKKEKVTEKKSPEERKVTEREKPQEEKNQSTTPHSHVEVFVDDGCFTS